MKTTHYFGILLVAISLLAGAAYAELSSEALIDYGKNVYVSGATYDPAVFFTGDTGTVTFEVTNGNPDESVTVNHAAFGDADIRLTSDTYDSSSSIGPGKARDYTFSVIANAEDGVYYPQFSLSFYGPNSLWEKEPVKVDNTRLIVLVTGKPDTFSQGVSSTITVQVSNPRDNDLKNVILYVTGEHAQVTPAEIYIGKLGSGESRTIEVSVTPDQATELEVAVDYSNGDNVHGVSTPLPVVFSGDKMQAITVISNIVVKDNNGIYAVTGDITNSGLQTANGVTVTSMKPAVPQDPYQNYVIGALKPDDFGSFELTFSAAEIDRVPILVSYKDRDGNVIYTDYTVNLAKKNTLEIKEGTPGWAVPVLAVVCIAIAIIGYLMIRIRKI